MVTKKTAKHQREGTYVEGGIQLFACTCGKTFASVTERRRHLKDEN